MGRRYTFVITTARTSASTYLPPKTASSSVGIASSFDPSRIFIVYVPLELSPLSTLCHGHDKDPSICYSKNIASIFSFYVRKNRRKAVEFRSLTTD